MSNPRFIFVVSAIFCALSSLGHAQKKDQILFQKEDLEKVRKEVIQSRQRLDSLKAKELEIQKAVANYDQRIASNRKVVSRLTSQLKQLKSDIAQTEQQLGSAEEQYHWTRRRYLGSIRQFYMSARRLTPLLNSRINGELELNRQVVYLTALSEFESGNVSEAEALLANTRSRITDLSGEQRKVSQLKKKKETATAIEATRKEKGQKALEQLRRKKSEEADRIMTLELAAQEMERIIARLDRERQTKAATTGTTLSSAAALSTLKGQLEPPCSGTIVRGFGHFQDEITKLKSFSPGITIRGRANRPVSAVAAGTVVYVGSLRGYNNFVIIDHGDQYYSTYGGLEGTAVAVNEYVLAGTGLALAAADGMVKFELRHGREALDPMKWIRIDAF